MDIIKELNVVEMDLFVNSFTIPHRVEFMVLCHTLFEVLVKFWIVSQMREILNANKCDYLIFSISILIAIKYTHINEFTFLVLGMFIFPRNSVRNMPYSFNNGISK